MKKIISIFIFLFISQFTYGQYQIGLVPRVSPDRGVSQKIGYTEVNVNYGSPAVKNRPVWGELVPYDKVWRAGANNATTVEFGSDVLINNTPLDSGKYALFILPKENDTWTIIFNKVHKQWGAFRYKKEEDALRIQVSPKKTDSHTENLTYSIHQSGFIKGSIVLNWEYLEVEIPFKTNYLEQFVQEVESRADKQPGYIKWIVYLQGAEHLEEMHFNLELAESWINKAEGIMNSTTEWSDQFYPRDYIKGHLFWVKAKLLTHRENFKEAIDYTEKIKKLENPIFYDREQETIDSLIDAWKMRVKTK